MHVRATSKLIKHSPISLIGLNSTHRSVPTALPRRQIGTLGVSAVFASIPRTIYQAFTTMTGSTDSIKLTSDQKWWDDKTVAIVTGGTIVAARCDPEGLIDHVQHAANKGIGKAIAEILVENGLTTVVAARDEGRGQEAVKDIKKSTGTDHVVFEQLDLESSQSIQDFGKRIKEKYPHVSILINNAGFAHKGSIFGAQEADFVLGINFRGTRQVCEAVAPLLQSPGRIVNVCSVAGKQRIIKDTGLLGRFQHAKSADDVAALSKEFVSGIKDGSYQQKGWPGSMYGVSKLCEATYTRILAEELKGKGIDVNACCPGYVDTDMSSHRGVKTPRQGADTPAYLALVAPKGTSARWWSDREDQGF